jgi:polysaccharide chain length determinant protein (PEP-CTERM system associated)
LLEYTDRHPDVIAVREALTRLEGQRSEQLRALGVANPDQELSTLGANPVYQAVQIALNEAEIEVATLTADASDRQRTLNELQALINEVPEVEAELAKLNRDYDVIREQYESLIQSRETQTLSRKASDSDQVDFRVLNPPQAGYAPVAPPRLLLLAAALVGALGAGGGLCYLIAQLRPVFNNSRALREASGLPVFGVVGRVMIDAAVRRRKRLELLSFSATMAGLVFVFGMVVYAEVFGSGLKALLLGAA